MTRRGSIRGQFSPMSGLGRFRFNLATGGTVADVSNYNGTGHTFRVHTFTSGGTFIVSENTNNFDYLIIAGGGGGGGGYQGGGGGAGGMLSGLASLNAESYLVTVGDGGRRAQSGQVNLNGDNSTALGVTVIGGGRGSGEMQAFGGPANYGATSGGSGGGTGHSIYQPALQGTALQGNAGGTNWGGCCSNAGGGGAGGVGGYAPSQGNAGVGGAGRSSNITGTVTFYAGGGGGANRANSNRASGGSGGGGAGGNNDTGGTGLSNTGGGGGGGGSNVGTGISGAGGSGVVIIAYRII